jgi:cytochrome c oxidase cbb3-type subunit 3
MKTQLTNSKLWLTAMLFLPVWNYAQETIPAEGPSYFSNALFNTLFVIILILLIAIIGMTQALKNIAQSDFAVTRFKKKDNDGTTSGTIKNVCIAFFLLAGLSSQAETNASSENTWAVGGLDMLTFYIMLTIILFEGIFIFVLYRLIMSFFPEQKIAVTVKPKTKTILEKINASVDVEKEHDILLDHDYDGIRELDNDLPPWWKYGFYLTVFVAVIYLINYHIAGTGDLQGVEYDKAVAQAKIEIEEYMKTAANNVDETTIKQLEGADLTSGKDLFIASCAACHGKEGQGGVGPNLTDKYWLHGGSLPDVFKSIKYGWVDKGMKSWKEDLSPVQIAQISSFIKTITGTNPAGAKVAQGDLFEEKVQIADSLIVKTDTLIVIKDSIK